MSTTARFIVSLLLFAGACFLISLWLGHVFGIVAQLVFMIPVFVAAAVLGSYYGRRA